MTRTTAITQGAEIGRDSVTRPGRRDGLRNSLRHRLAGMMDRVSTTTRWIISAAVGLITPAVLIAESAVAPAAADAIACFGNGSFMALAATANAFTMVP